LTQSSRHGQPTTQTSPDVPMMMSSGAVGKDIEPAVKG
jgi:hypothetical protein